MRFIRLLLAAVPLLPLLAATAAGAAELTAVEQRWIAASTAVLDAAAAEGLPVGIVVQPQAAPGATPVAMAYVDGRCKLVFTLRGNPAADTLLADAPAALQPLLMEVVIAHELGHCWRHAQGAWQPATGSDWREEAYADLAALAWTAQRHPERYAEVHAWLSALRIGHAGSAHDTRPFLAAVREPTRFAAAAANAGDSGSGFAQALRLWQQAIESPRR